MSNIETEPKAPSSKNADGIYEPFDIAQVPVEAFSRGERFEMRWQHLSSYGGGTQIGVAIETLAPGKQTNQAHYHLLEEEHVFILEGELTVRLGDRHYLMKAGHYVCFPAGQKAAHTLINHSDAPCRYVLVGNTQSHDVIFYPDTQRVGVKLAGQSFRSTATMDYWDGVVTDQPPEIPRSPA